MKTLPFLISSILVLFNGCASSYYVSSTRLLSSETEGRQGFSIEGGVHEIHRVYITHDLNGTPINDQVHDLDQSVTIGAGASYGLLESLDLGARYDVDAAPMIYAKYQILGESKRKSKPGNFSLSVVASGGYAGNETDTSDDISSTSTLTRTGHGVYEAEGIIGYRLNPQVLILSGASVLWQNIDGHQDFTSGSPLVFHDASRFTEMHGGALIYFEPESTETAQRAFFTPMLQWGWIDTFGSRFYSFTAQANVGIQF